MVRVAQGRRTGAGPIPSELAAIHRDTSTLLNACHTRLDGAVIREDGQIAAAQG